MVLNGPQYEPTSLLVIEFNGKYDSTVNLSDPKTLEGVLAGANVNVVIKLGMIH
jgi:hypothetical protein